MADTPRPMNISDACTEIFRLEGMVRELRAEVEEAKALCVRLRGQLRNAEDELERYTALLHRVRAEVGRMELGETLSDEIDAARFSASGATPNTTEGA